MIQNNLVTQPDMIAYKIHNQYLYLQVREEGYDYLIFDLNYNLLDDGVYDNPNIDIKTVAKILIEDFPLQSNIKELEQEEIYKIQKLLETSNIY